MARIFLTGASAGIGAATADLLADHELVLLGRRPEELRQRFPRALVLEGDLSSPATLAGAVASIADEPLDGLVHLAGSSSRARIEAADLDGWSRDLAVNLLAPLALTAALLPALRQARGSLVVVNSVNGLWGGGAGSSSYTASKTALRSFTDQVRVEEPLVRVTSIYPGPVATEMQRELREYLGHPYRPELYAAADSIAAAVRFALFAPADVEVRDLTVTPSAK
jgi:NADP-dependent 3-hydroxy acid dehydrogenase YdfG